MRKPDFTYAKTKAQISCAVRNNCAANQHLCFRYTYNTIPLLPKSSFFCGCTFQFVSDLVGNAEDRFSSDAAYF